MKIAKFVPAYNFNPKVVSIAMVTTPIFILIEGSLPAIYENKNIGNCTSMRVKFWYSPHTGSNTDSSTLAYTYMYFFYSRTVFKFNDGSQAKL